MVASSKGRKEKKMTLSDGPTIPSKQQRCKHWRNWYAAKKAQSTWTVRWTDSRIFSCNGRLPERRCKHWMNGAMERKVLVAPDEPLEASDEHISSSHNLLSQDRVVFAWRSVAWNEPLFNGLCVGSSDALRQRQKSQFECESAQWLIALDEPMVTLQSIGSSDATSLVAVAQHLYWLVELFITLPPHHLRLLVWAEELKSRGVQDTVKITSMPY